VTAVSPSLQQLDFQGLHQHPLGRFGDLPGISNNVGSVKSFFGLFLNFFSFERTTRFTLKILFVSFTFALTPRLVRNFSIGFSPTQHLIDQNFGHPLQGTGCPIRLRMFYRAPCPVPSCPAHEPNSLNLLLFFRT